MVEHLQKAGEDGLSVTGDSEQPEVVLKIKTKTKMSITFTSGYSH